MRKLRYCGCNLSTNFKDFLVAQKVAVEEDLFDRDAAFVRAMIRYDIDLALFGVETARRRLLAEDPQAQFALAQFPEAVRLAQLGKGRNVATRGDAR